MAKRYYVGYSLGKTDVHREVFLSEGTPTEASHGAKFGAVIGPFQTKAGAVFMADYGQGNPHCQTVAEAERLAKRERTHGSASPISRVVKTKKRRMNKPRLSR